MFTENKSPNGGFEVFLLLVFLLSYSVEKVINFLFGMYKYKLLSSIT